VIEEAEARTKREAQREAVRAARMLVRKYKRARFEVQKFDNAKVKIHWNKTKAELERLVELLRSGENDYQRAKKLLL
jgi:hypothetical protein